MKTFSSSSKSGSALLLTLLVVSLLLVIVLSMSVYVRMELRTVENNADLIQARQNAKLGMHLALAQLQRAAGADQRVTARAEIEGPTILEPNRYWTGVWRNNGSGSALSSNDWLVSGNSPDPTQLGENLVEILPAFGSNAAITVSAEEIDNQSGDRIGDFAYWISDEGVKISLSKIDQEKQINFLAAERGLTDSEMELLPQITPGRFRNELLFPSITNWDNIAENVMKTSSYKQFTFTGLSEAILESQRHRATWRSMGVLSNSEKGGLKQDLSFVSSSSSMDFSKSPGLQKWVQHRTTDGVLDFTGYPISDPIALKGEPIFTIPVVITEFGIYMRFSRLTSGNALRFQIAVRPEFWNPFSFPQRVTPQEDSDLIFEITGLPELSCTWITGTNDTNVPPNIAQGNFQLDPNTLTYFREDVIEEQLSSLPVRFNQTPGFLDPGEVYHSKMIKIEVPIGVTMTQDSTTGTGGKKDDFIEIQADKSEVTLRVKTLDGDLLQEFKKIPFPEFDTTGRWSENDQLTGSKVTGRGTEDFQLLFHFRLEDETPNTLSTEPGPIDNWFNETDPRSLAMPASVYNDVIAISEPDEAALTSFFQSQPDLFNRFRFFPAFDIPAGPPISVGSLQHLQFAETPPFTVGNSWGNKNDGFGNPFNGYFDSYFFSTVPQNGIDYNPKNGIPLANTHLKVQEIPEYTLDLDSVQKAFSSKHFLVDGSFNINSIDPFVWQAVLGSLNLTDWEYDADSAPRDLAYGVFRSPFGASLNKTHPKTTYPLYPEIEVEEKAAWYRDGSTPMWANAFKVGMRELRESELENVASEIADRISSRNIPFISIRELADSELIQNSIDATLINTTDGRSYEESDTNNRIPKNAPAFVSQADILQLIAPFISARSDTFIIRSYGNSRNETTIYSEQYCEAVIQRTTEPLTFRNSSDALTTEQDYLNPPNEFGRRFKIVSFKWVTP